MIESRLGLHFLEQPYEPMRKTVDCNLISTLWEFAQEYSITLRNHSNYADSSNDGQYIMDKAVRHQIHNLPLFDSCRLYLQVERLSNILTADGKCIRQAIWNGQRQPFSTPVHNWPFQPQPSTKGWNVWRQDLRAFTGANEEVRLPVYFPPMSSRVNWIWFFSPSENRVFEMRQQCFPIMVNFAGDYKKI
jgi:hypothetical protein